MKTEDRRDYIDRYEKRLQQFGYSPETLGWGKNGRQELRFAVLADAALKVPACSVLDVGCGFCDLYDFLRARGWEGAYTGIDIVPGLLRIARERHPGLDIREADITVPSFPADAFDFVIASGVLNAALPSGDNRTHIASTLRAMLRAARVAAAVDFLSTFVDFQKPGAWHTDPAWAFATAREMTRRVQLRHDYMPYEFALFLFRDDTVSERNVFQAAERELLGSEH